MTIEKTSPMDSDKVKKKIKSGELKIEGKAHNEVEPRPIEEGVPESVIKAEGKAHQREDKKIVIPEKVHEALEKKAKAEGKSVTEKVAEIIEQKAKESPFPCDAEINDYGFLHFRIAWLESLGWSKGMPLKIEKNADGSITLRKA
jgi:hypothetical protein